MNLEKLRDDMVAAFNEAELRMLCSRFGVEYGRLGGANQLDKTVSLIGYMGRHGRLQEVVQEMVRERPNLATGYGDYLGTTAAEAETETAGSDTALDWLIELASGKGAPIEEPPTMKWPSDVHEKEDDE